MFAMFLGGIGFLVTLFFLPLGLLTLAFWIWMLVDAAQNRGLDQNEKVVWLVVVALLHFVGAFIYFLFGRPKRKLAPPV